MVEPPHYQRTGRKYHPNEILPFVQEYNWHEGLYKASKIDIDGHKINVRSMRLYTFKKHGVVCCCCGIIGAFFVKERHRKQSVKTYHLNLYALRDDHEVMLTSDHIVPRCQLKGGGIKNRQTLCTTCNNIKDDRELDLPDLFWEVMGVQMEVDNEHRSINIGGQDSCVDHIGG